MAVEIGRRSAGTPREVVAEAEETLSSVDLVGGKLICQYLRDAHSLVRIHGVDGSLVGEVELPGIGTAEASPVTATTPRPSTPTPTSPPRRRSTATRWIPARALCSRAPSRPSTSPATRRNRSSSRARTAPGCRCSSSTRRDRAERTKPDAALRLRRLQQLPHTLLSHDPHGVARDGRRARDRQPPRRRRVRRAWHLAGTKLQKQNVFDDFIAAAEWLIANGYTRPPSSPSRAAATAACWSAPS